MLSRIFEPLIERIIKTVFTMEARASAQRFVLTQMSILVIWVMLLCILMVVAKACLFSGSSGVILIGGGMASFVFWVSFALVLIAHVFISIQRLHDLGKNGWWLLWLLVPGPNVFFILWIYFGNPMEEGNPFEHLPRR